ncbi:MAG: monovalent cation/H+ antiporter complex subunit F [Pseudomonadota bacterium]
MNLYPLLMAVLGLATIPGLLRLLRGPTEADRVIGLDLLFAVAVAGCVLAALASGRAVFLDVGIGIALIGFVATLAWARLVATRPARRAP